MRVATQRFASIAERRAAGEKDGIASVCSAHPLVIEATLRHGVARRADVTTPSVMSFFLASASKSAVSLLGGNP